MDQSGNENDPKFAPLKKRMSMISAPSASMSFLEVEQGAKNAILSPETLVAMNTLIDSFQKPPEDGDIHVSTDKKSTSNKESTSSSSGNGWSETFKGMASNWRFNKT